MTYTATGRVLTTPTLDDNEDIVPNSWQVLEPLKIWKDGDLYAETTPFQTDLASIPSFLNIDLIGLSKTSSNQRAAVCHDWLYQERFGKREDADRAFLDIMEQDGVPYWKRYLQYWAVRIGGQSAWDSD